MKVFKFLAIVAVTFCMATMVGCEDETTDYIFQMSPLAVPAPYFDADAIAGTQLTLRWTAVPAAYSYTVKWWKEGNEANATVETVSSNSYVLKDLTSMTTYYAQVKANAYDGLEDCNSDYCAVLSCSTNDESVKPSIEVTLFRTSSSTLTFDWDLDNLGVDETVKYDYYLSLYKDEACTDLWVSWIIDKSNFNVETSGVIPYARFTFTGLDPGTTYWMVANVNDDESRFSAPCEATTETFDYVSLDDWTSNQPQVGDVLIAEDFHGLIHAGDMAYKAIGVTLSSGNRNNYKIPTGINPTDCGQPVEYSTEWNIFTSPSDSYLQATGLFDWCMGTGTNASTRPGYIKLGGGSGAFGFLATPELTMIPDGVTATVQVDYLVMGYYQDTNTTEYGNKMLVAVVDNASVSSHQAAGWTTTSDLATLTDSSVVDITDAGGNNKLFVSKSVTLTGVTNKSRIRFSSDPATSGPTSTGGVNKSRFFLDNIVITVTELN